MVSVTANLADDWTAERFLATDQKQFGPLWRYELVNGIIIGQAVQSDRHATILTNLAAALKGRLIYGAAAVGCGVVPRNQQRPNVRIPDAAILCNREPRVIFDVVSLDDLIAWQQWDYRRDQLQDVPEVEEIFELYQDQVAAHAYRKTKHSTWQFDSIREGAMLHVRSVGISFPLAELYEDVDLAVEEREG
jgi:Uma2 family endonuclease